MNNIQLKIDDLHSDDFDKKSFLTARQCAVLRRISMPNEVIAKSLKISIETVKFHIKVIRRKLAIKNRSELIAYSIEFFGWENIIMLDRNEIEERAPVANNYL